jgi:hypothetical protein
MVSVKMGSWIKENGEIVGYERYRRGKLRLGEEAVSGIADEEILG